MHADGKKLLQLMFRPGEKACVSYNQFGYHSIPVENIMDNGTVTLVPTQDSVEKRNEGRRYKNLPLLQWEECFETISTDKLLLVALNPIEGFRTDDKCIKYRNFLIEMDYGTNEEQMAYVNQLKMPFSAAIFSGGKSIHFLVSLDTDLPSEDVYRLFSVWAVSIATLADPNTINPSRSIRIPGAERDPGKFQQLLEYRGPVKVQEWANWLNLFPNAKPKPPEKRERKTDGFDFNSLKPWLKKRLLNGLDPTKGRNKQWFAIACEFALAGYSEDDTIGILENYFEPDRTFKRKEWLTSVKSGFDYVYKNK